MGGISFGRSSCGAEGADEMRGESDGIDPWFEKGMVRKRQVRLIRVERSQG